MGREMIINDTFRGIPSPTQTFQLGRPDLVDRPGDALIEIVSAFRAEGGFQRLQDDRHLDEAPVVSKRPDPNLVDDRRLSRWFEGEMSDNLDLEG